MLTSDTGSVPSLAASPLSAPKVSSALVRALEGIYARVPLGMRLGLDPMRASCTRSGDPQNGFVVAHIAGTNGKGSTCAMVESMVRAAGKRTGLFTSPHLCRFAERIRINGEPLADDDLADVLMRALDLGPDLSFFETATLAAFLAFRDHGVDLAVLEVGLGGRLDATNVVPPPRVTAITRIALDHTDRLGTTLEAIAREKAGIAKAGSPLVLGPMAPEARAAALEIALAAGALPILLGDDPDAAAREALPLSLRGTYQHDNARIASRIARELGVAESARREGLARASWPGRFEAIVVPRGSLRGAWLLDGAHNPDAARALVAALADDAALGSRPPAAMVFGALADKDWPEMLDVFEAIRCPRVYVAPRGRTAADPRELARRVPGRVAPSVADALALARNDGKDRDAPVVVCGSLALVGEARGRLLGLPMDPPVAL